MIQRHLLSSLVLLVCLQPGCSGDAPTDAKQNATEQSQNPKAAGKEGELPKEAAAKVEVIKVSHTIPLFRGQGGSLAMSADGSRLIAAGAHDGDKDGMIRVIVYDVTANKPLREFESYSIGVLPVSISADGKLAAYFTRANFVKVVDVEQGEELHEFKNDLLTGYYSYHLQISPDAKSVWTYVEGAEIVSSLLGWSLETGQPLPSLTAEGSTVLCLSLFADSKQIVAGYRNGDVRIWAIAEGKSVELRSGIKPGPAIAEREISIKMVAVSPSGKYVAAGILGLQPQMWDAKSKQLLHELPVGGMGPTWALGFDPSEKFLVCQGEWLTPEGETDYGKEGKAIHVFDVQSGARLAMLELPAGDVGNIAWGGSSLYVAMGSGDIQVFDLTPLRK
jgi:WD40 repeat protein